VVFSTAFAMTGTYSTTFAATGVLGLVGAALVWWAARVAARRAAGAV
jgi:hypothetical protein